MECALRVVQRIRLGHGETARLGPQAAGTLRVVCGRVWLTEAGLRQDALLAKGDCHRFRAPGPAVVEGLDTAVMEVLVPAAGAPLALHAAWLLAAAASLIARLRARAQFGPGDPLAPTS